MMDPARGRDRAEAVDRPTEEGTRGNLEDAVMRGVRVLGAIALITASLLSGAAKCEGPNVTPGEDADDVVTILQVWTYEPEPVRARLSVHNGEGIPLLADKGSPLSDYVIEFTTSVVKEGAAATWEFELYADATLHGKPNVIAGTIKLDVARGVKGGCKLLARDKAGKRENLGQDQSWQGPRPTCLFSRTLG